MTIKTAPALLDNIPDAITQARSGGGNNISRQHSPTIRDAIARSLTRVLGDSETELVTDDGSSSSTVSAYYVQYSAGAVLVGGVYKRFAAADDQDLLNDDIVGHQIAIDDDGVITVDTPAALDDGDTVWVAIVAIVVNGAVQLRAIWGEAATDSEEVAVSDAHIKGALEAASITNLETHIAAVVGRIKIARSSTTITMTHTDPASDDSLAAERAGANNPFGVTAA